MVTDALPKKATSRRKPRPKGQGGIHYSERKKLYVIRLQDPLTKKRLEKYARTQSEAHETLRLMQNDVQQGRNFDRAKTTLFEVCEEWVNSRTANTEQNQLRNAQYLRNQLAPYPIAKVPLLQLTDVALSQHYDLLQTKNLRRAIKPKTVLNFSILVKAAIQRAINQGIISRNVAELVPPIVVPHEEAEFWEPEEVAALFAALEKEQAHFENMAKLALITGMRQGELFSLTWDRVDFDRQLILVTKSVSAHTKKVGLTKTPSGKRRVALDEYVVGCLKNQAKTSANNSNNPLNLVFPNRAWRHQAASNFLDREWYPFLERNGLRKLKFHCTRHTAASTMLLLANEPGSQMDDLFIVRQLGHRDEKMLYTTYGHVLERMKAKNVAQIGKFYQGLGASSGV